MYILGGAVAFAKTKITNSDITGYLTGAGKPAADNNTSSIVETRCSVLNSSDYFSLNGKARFSAERGATPTALGVEAVTTACEALGIATGEIGLLLGDCSTPRQTIPAESHRICGSLGLKIPSFDILAPVIAPIMHFDLLSRWKKDQLPKYIALVYTNAPTGEPSLVSSDDRFKFGDGATALIVSREISRGLLVEQTKVRQEFSDNKVIASYDGGSSASIFGFETQKFNDEIATFAGKQICFASPSKVLLDIAEKNSNGPALTGGVSQSGFALSTSVAATIIEAISYGQAFGIFSHCGSSYANRHIEEGVAMFLKGVGYFHPTTIIDNEFITSLGIDTNEEWIVSKIGIQQRRTVLPLDYIRETKNQDPEKALAVASHTPTDLAEQAIVMACQRAGITPSQIGMLVCDNCFPSYLVPTESERIAARIGAQDCLSFDALTACPASALHAHILHSFEPEMLPDYIACITTSALTTVTNYTDRTDPAIWGDGAAAMIYSPRKKGKLKLIDTFFSADPTRCGAVIIDRYGFFHQDGRAVRDFSVRQTVRMLREVEKKHSIDWQRDVFIGHQANVTMLQQIVNNREIPDTNHWRNADQFGNQASAGAPIVLGMNWERLQTGQKIVMAVLGSGLSWGYAVFDVQ